MKKRTLFTKLVFLVISVVITSLLVTTVFVGKYIETRERSVVEARISALARIVAQNGTIIQALENEDMSGTIQTIAQNTLENTGVDFVVVMDTAFKRYSHPTVDIIGGTFSNIADARQTLETGDHFSYKDGTLGAGVRYFTRIYNQKGDIIGIVCVGYRQVTITSQIMLAFGNILIALLIGLGVAFVLAYFFTRWLKKELLDLEPNEIARVVLENTYVSEHITEGILAINKQCRVIFINSQILKLFEKAQYRKTIKVGDRIDSHLFDVLFKQVMEEQAPLNDKQIIMNHLELLMNCNPIYLNGQMYGAVATLRDQSDLKQLITELSSTEKYNDTLRAQNHHFMNQVHVLQGLIELQHFKEAEQYIHYLKRNYHRHLGHVSERIKVPVLAGLLLGKIEEANQQGIDLTIDTESDVPNGQYVTLYHDMTIILGVLIDNAMEAVGNQPHKLIDIYLCISQEEQVVMCVVEDTGNGIPEESRLRIFKRGYSTKGENRGYGLEAVEAIVTKYGGVIEVGDSVNGGARVSIEIPLMEATNENIGY